MNINNITVLESIVWCYLTYCPWSQKYVKLTWRSIYFLFLLFCATKRFNIHWILIKGISIVSVFRGVYSSSFNRHSSFYFPLFFLGWWTARKWAVSPLFLQREHLYSIPGSRVSYSGFSEIMSVERKVLQINLSWCFWGQFDIHALFFYLDNYKGMVQNLDKVGVWRVGTRNEMKVAKRLRSETARMERGDELKWRWVTGHEKRLRLNSCFWGLPPPSFFFFTGDFFSLSPSLNRICTHWDWFIFIAVKHLLHSKMFQLRKK